MKNKLITAIILAVVIYLVPQTSYAQIPTDTGSLRTKVNTDIVPNSSGGITATKLNHILNGVLNLYKAYAIDSAYRINDTLFLVRRLGFTTIKVTMASGGAPSEADPTVSSAAKTISAGDITNWNSKQAAITNSATVSIIANVVQAANTTAQWNADKLQGRNVGATAPTTNQVLGWNGTAWIPIDQTGGAADGNNLTTSTAFNTASGILTTSRSGLSALTVDLDGRYVQGISRSNDSVFAIINGTSFFAYKDSVGAGGTANLDTTRNSTSATIIAPGTDAVIALVDVGSNKAGLMSPTMKIKLDSAILNRLDPNDSVTCWYRKDGLLVRCDTSRALIAAKSLNAATVNSMELDGDQETPGNYQNYATNSAGTKGYTPDGAGIRRLDLIVGFGGAPGDSTTIFIASTLINKTLISVQLEGQYAAFTPRTDDPYITFVSATGTITLHNAVFATNESVIIHYREGATDISIFSPGDVPNMFGWWDVTDATKRTVAGGLVTSLTDKSGNGRTMNQKSGGTFPSFSASGGPSSLPAMTYVNGNEIVTSTFTAVSQPITVYVVLKQNSHNSSTQNFVMSFNNSNGFQFQQIARSAGNSTVMFAGNNFPKNANGYQTQWAVYRMTFKNDTSILKINDEIYQRTGYSVGLAGGSTMNLIGVGPYYRTASASISEIIVYTGTMSNANDSAIVNHLMSKYGISNTTYFAFFGDSITWGAASSDVDSAGFAALTSNELDRDIINFGYPGTTVHTGSGGTAGANLTDIYTQAFTGNLTTGYFIFSYGTNDAGITTEGAAPWKAAYKGVIQDFINRGADPHKIIIMTTPWRPSIGSSYLQTCNDKAAEIASELGTKFLDLVTYLGANGAGANLDVDGIHLNNTGHRNTANALKAKILE
jgi:lysophospholipase L1-like esterase